MAVLRAFGLYTLLTLLSTWPLIQRLHLMDAGDSAFFAWEIGWELHALGTDPRLLPHAPIFHPLRHTLAFDEPILGTTLLALPLALFTSDAVVLYNVVRLLTYLLSAVSAYLLARQLGCGEAVSLLAGAAFAFSPIRTDQIAHLSTLGTQYLPLVLLFLHRFARGGRLLDALAAALAFLAATYACGYHGLIGLAVLPGTALVLLWGRWGRWRSAVFAGAVAAAGLLPLYALHHAGLSPLAYVRDEHETRVYSASLESLLATSSWNRVYGAVTAPFRTTNANNLFPGLVLPALAGAGAWRAWRARRRPGREAWALAALALASVAVALGPEVRVLGRTLFPGPFALLREVVPLFQNIRVPSRAGAWLALALAMLAAKALAAWRPRPAVLAAVSAAALLETLVVPIPMPGWSQVVDTRRGPPAVYAWLASQPGEPTVAELPMLDIHGVLERPAYHESIYLVHQTRHWKPLVNGYAGLEPPHYVRLREELRRFPSVESLAALRALGTRYVVLHVEGYGPLKRARLERELPGFAADLREVARFGGDVVYELVAR